MTARVPFPVPASWSLRPSPHHSARTQPVTAIVLHADASATVEGTLSWLRDPASKVSYHVVVSRLGAVFCVVNPDAKAWHAGESVLDGQRYCNGFSVGVCLSNRNDGREPYPTDQRTAAARVCALLCLHYGFASDRITTHALVSPGRKTDPLGLDLLAFRAQVDALLAAATT